MFVDQKLRGRACERAQHESPERNRRSPRAGRSAASEWQFAGRRHHWSRRCAAPVDVQLPQVSIAPRGAAPAAQRRRHLPRRARDDPWTRPRCRSRGAEPRRWRSRASPRTAWSIAVTLRPNTRTPPTSVNSTAKRAAVACVAGCPSERIVTRPRVASEANMPTARNGAPKSARQPPPSRISRRPGATSLMTGIGSFYRPLSERIAIVENVASDATERPRPFRSSHSSRRPDRQRNREHPPNRRRRCCRIRCPTARR